MLKILGVKRTWERLVNGESGLVSLQGRKLHEQQQCQVAGLVPTGTKKEGAWNAREWLSNDEQRRMPAFMQYATVASLEALKDAAWFPETAREQERTV